MKRIAVVSLVDELIRRKHIDHLFLEHRLDFSYFDAINKQQIADTLERYNLVTTTDRMSAGEVACYLSHYSLWQQLIEEQMPYLMVFEDDIYFSASAKILLNNVDWLPDGFDLIKLETMYEDVRISSGTNLQFLHKLCRMKSQHLGTAGYIISYDGAKKIIDMVKQAGLSCPVDHLMFDKFIKYNNHNVYQLSPALCIQDKVYNSKDLKFKSTLEEERKPQKIAKKRLSTSQKVNRELNRLWNQFKIAEKYHIILLTVRGYRKQRIDYQE